MKIPSKVYTTMIIALAIPLAVTFAIGMYKYASSYEERTINSLNNKGE